MFSSKVELGDLPKPVFYNTICTTVCTFMHKPLFLQCFTSLGRVEWVCNSRMHAKNTTGYEINLIPARVHACIDGFL